MKKIEVRTVIYDRTTMEYVQKIVTHTISDELAEMLKKELSESNGSAIEVRGHGAGDNPNNKIPGIRTPLCSQKRFYIDPRFHVIDEDGKQLAGWCGF